MTNVNYLLISGPLKGNISQMTWVVLLCWVDCFQTLLERRSLRWQKQPPTAVDLYLLIKGGLHLCCSAMLSWCPPHVRCRRWAQSERAASVASCWPLFCCPSTSDKHGFLAGVSSAAPPKLQDSGTSAMQKSIYSQSYRRERAKRDRDS